MPTKNSDHQIASNIVATHKRQRPGDSPNLIIRGPQRLRQPIRLAQFFLGVLTMARLTALIALIPLKDIFVNALGAFLGGLALLWFAMGSRGISMLRSKVGRPSVRIEQRRTPENIFTGLELGAPVQWVQQQLGAPTRVGEKWWGYRFSDSLVSLRLSSTDSIESIAVALIDTKTTFDFPAWHFDCPPLGKANLGDLLDVEHLFLAFNDSTRHSELIVSGREGPKGAWHYIAFGALDPHIPGPLLPSEFKWDKEKKVLVGNPRDVKINWAAVSISPHVETFPWDFGLKI